MKIPFLSVILILISFLTVHSQEVEYSIEKDIHYYPDSISSEDAYTRERCVLDVYYPANISSYPTVVWFHGGGLRAGEKYIPDQLKEAGFAVVGVNYRLYPKVKAPSYIEDAAAAVAWVFKNIGSYGGDSTLIFVSGHSAGGYLASMIGLDKKYLNACDIDADRIAGLIPFSGHTITHFTPREEKGIPGTQALIDHLAPLYHVREDAPPLLLITGDRELEMLGRYEENAYMYRMMKVVGHKDTRLLELDGYNHGGMASPAFPLLLKEVWRIADQKKN